MTPWACGSRTCRRRTSECCSRSGRLIAMPTKVILDVDTGTDDAVALMTAALSPDVELVGATTVNGNTTIDNTTENTLRVFDWIRLPHIPVHRGMDRPLARTQMQQLNPASRIHGSLL